MMRNLLLVDHSGRGHALAECLSRTSPGLNVHYVPGCGAISTSRVFCDNSRTLQDPEALCDYAATHSIDAAFVSNATALGSGFVDYFRSRGIPTIGADKTSSRLETSKVFGKRMCSKYGVPVAEYETFSDSESAKEYIRTREYPVVVKADGLCAGAGTFVCENTSEAEQAVDRIMVERAFGDAGSAVVVEKRLYGRELSFFAFTDGAHFRLFPLAADYPKSGAGNTGVTCGGVGAFSPHPLDTLELRAAAGDEIFRPLMRCLEEERLDFSGFLYVGAMLAEDKLYVLEINIRFGDPEAQAVLPRVTSDLGALFESALTRSILTTPFEIDPEFRCAVVAYQGRTKRVTGGKGKGWHRGWPLGSHGKGYPISGVEDFSRERAELFLGQARLDSQKGLVTDGGRVLTVSGRGPDLETASAAAYEQIRKISFEGMSFREDIGRCLPWS